MKKLSFTKRDQRSESWSVSNFELKDFRNSEFSNRQTVLEVEIFKVFKWKLKMREKHGLQVDKPTPSRLRFCANVYY